jgi:hypothetical protein
VLAKECGDTLGLSVVRGVQVVKAVEDDLLEVPERRREPLR